jgi:Tol biopolymer transport system component
VTIEVDGKQQHLTTEAETVREALEQANVILNQLDRVKPDLYTTLDYGMVIIVTRVEEKIVVEPETIPFEQQTITNEALAPSETRLAQLGVNGEQAVSFRLIYENGLEISKVEIGREVITPPIPEILVVGPQGKLTPISFAGTIVYLSNDNVWLMRDNSSNRRALITENRFDGHVFSLSPAGHHLLYTQSITDKMDMPINKLWLASTTIVGEQPVALEIEGIIDAAWSPVISPSLVAYSTAERSAGTPGWKANNDLWLFNPLDEQAKPVQILPVNMEGLYAWWGTKFVWSPDGTRLAYARPDQIGVITFTTQSPITYNIKPLVDFVPLETLSEWVWVPQPSWSPDGKFLAAVIHGQPVAGESPEESQQFDLLLFNAEEKFSVKVAGQVGMWANPVWGEFGIAFGEAIEPLQSVNSRYKIQVVDVDGSNQHQLFPYQAEPGVQLPKFTWSPDGEQLLFVYNGNLYLTHHSGTPPRQMTADSQVTQVSWAVPTSIMTDTTSMTNSLIITPITVLTK